MYDNIEKKHEELIKCAKQYMSLIEDREHDVNHMNDVVTYVKKILDNIDEKLNVEVCIIGSYWHDVGRTKVQQGHEKVSAQMLAETMKKMNYDQEFTKKCCDSIEFHKHDMEPTTIEGLVVKDADKVAWVGSGRWKSCINKRQRLDSLVELLPKLRNEILHFDYSKKLYDQEIVKVLEILYKEIYGE